MDKFYMWLAWILPKRLVKWCYVRVVATASASEKLSSTEMGNITVIDALKEWE